MYYTIFLLIINKIKRIKQKKMLDITRPKITIPDDSKIKINQYRNPYLTKLTIKILPNYAKINGPTLLNPLQNHNNIAIAQSLPLWRNQKFRIGLLWQQNIRNTFNRSHIGIGAQYQMSKNWLIRSKNLVGNSFLTTTQISKILPLHGRLITVSGMHSCFFESSSQYYHTLSSSITFDSNLTFAVDKRIGSQTALRAYYQKPLQNDIFLRLKYDTELQRFQQSVVQVGLGYYFNKDISAWLRTSLQSNKVQPNVALQFQMRRNKNNHCFVGSVEYRNQKSIIYLGYKCPSFNFIFPIFGTDSIIPAIVGLGAYLYGYWKRQKQQGQTQQQQNRLQTKQKNRFDELKLISDKANQNYKRQEIQNGLLIQQVYVGEKNLLDRFLAQDQRSLKLNRIQDYKNNIYDGTVSFRFYVQKNQLNLPKGNKLSMLGFYYRVEDGQDIAIYVRYIKQGKQYEKIYTEKDAIIL